MKLSLTVETDAINVLALNMGRIAVDKRTQAGDKRQTKAMKSYHVNSWLLVWVRRVSDCQN